MKKFISNLNNLYKLGKDSSGEVYITSMYFSELTKISHDEVLDDIRSVENLCSNNCDALIKSFINNFIYGGYKSDIIRDFFWISSIGIGVLGCSTMDKIVVLSAMCSEKNSQVTYDKFVDRKETYYSIEDYFNVKGVFDVVALDWIANYISNISNIPVGKVPLIGDAVRGLYHKIVLDEVNNFISRFSELSCRRLVELIKEYDTLDLESKIKS